MDSMGIIFQVIEQWESLTLVIFAWCGDGGVYSLNILVQKLSEYKAICGNGLLNKVALNNWGGCGYKD